MSQLRNLLTSLDTSPLSNNVTICTGYFPYGRDSSIIFFVN